MSDANPKLPSDSTETPEELHSSVDRDDEWELRNVDRVRRIVEPKFFSAREYLRNPDFGNEGAEGYVSLMCREYLLPLLMARGRELLNADHSEPTLGQEMRGFTRAELAKLERMHWSPARDEFGAHCCFTKEAFQEGFESEMLRVLESKLLPALRQEAVREHGQRKPNGDAARESTTRGRKRGPKPDYKTALRVAEIVARVAPDGDWRSRRDEICEALDDEKIPFPAKWRRDQQCRCWADCLEAPLVVKAIQYRLEMAKQLKKPTPEIRS